MIVHNCQQGDREWTRLRLGIPTASAFDQIITPKTLKPAKGDAYLLTLLAEWALGKPLESFSSSITQRGRDNEEQGRIAYKYEIGGDLHTVGFITTDDGRVGGSPDALIGEDAGLEVKVCMAKAHVGYLFDPDSLAANYRCQVQGYLWLTGRAWWDLISCHDGEDPLPMVRIRCEPDTEWREAFEAALSVFLERLEEGKARLRARGVER